MDKSNIRICIVDDEKHHADAIKEALELSGYTCEVSYSSEEGQKLLKNNKYDVLITDLVMRSISGMELIKLARRNSTDIIIFAMTAFGSVETAVEAMKNGANDYLTKPINLQELQIKLEKELKNQERIRENISLKKEIDKRYGFHQIIGNSKAIREIIEKIKVVAPTMASVLIEGESGTGKELVAHAIHIHSNRIGNFVPLNCAALSETLLESELFGHEKGAFTGAIYQRKGRVEFADQGTLFLDEIGDMPPSVQIKLLRTIETHEIYRVGSNTPIKVDFRLISATNRNLEQLVQEGKFREDLYYRLKVVSIYIPPLRERQQDIPLLIDAFVKQFSEKYNKKVNYISPEVRNILFRYPWPGNVRELKNCIENMIVMMRGDELTIDDIPLYISQKKSQIEAEPLTTLSGVSVGQAEYELIKNTLKDTNNNLDLSAKLLGISKRTLYRKLKRYNISIK